MEWEEVKNALNLATSDFRALLSTGEVLSLEPKDVIMLIEHAEKSQQQLTEKDAIIKELQEAVGKPKIYLLSELHNERIKYENACTKSERLRKALEEAWGNFKLIKDHRTIRSKVSEYCDAATYKIEAALGEGDKE